MPSKTRQPRPTSQSRFQEGSMNDRTSAAPPVQFLENEENIPPASYYDNHAKHHQHSYYIPPKPVPVSTPTATIRTIRDDELDDYVPRPQPKEKTAVKKSSRIFGQVWDGVFGILSGKGGSSNGGGSGRKKTPSMISTASTATSSSAKGRDSKELKIDELRARLQQNDNAHRPSKEDVMQSYQELVASGFFSSHAIQSTRHSRPGTARSNAANPPAPAGDLRPTSPPQWPLSTPSKKQNSQQLLHQHQPHTLSPIPMTPGSAGSRGTKRAAATEDDDDDDDQDTAPRFGSRKLRKSASRDVSGAGPRLRSVSSRRILSRRSFSGAPSKNPPSQPPQALVTLAGPLQPTASPGKLTKRCPQTSANYRHSIRAPLPVPGRSSSASTTTTRGGGRNVSENVALHVASDLDTRVLRPRRSALTGAEARSVRPDLQRGIPGVPAIPPEFTYGEDREVGGPWRGLRR